MRRACVALAALFVLAPLAGAQEDADTRHVTVEIHDEGCPSGEDRFCILPGEIEADEDRTLVLEVTNEGSVRHNLTVPRGGPSGVADRIPEHVLEPGESVTIELPWEVLSEAKEPGQAFELVCGFEGHADLGERLSIQVGEEEENPQPGFTAGALVMGVLVASMVARWRS